MNWLGTVILSNAVAALVLALVAVVLSRCVRRPALTHALWLLVLLKLITPPLVWLPVSWPALVNSSSSTQHSVSVRNSEELPSQPGLEERDGEGDDLPAILPDLVAKEQPNTLEEQELLSPVGALATEDTIEIPWPLVAALVWGAGSLLWLTLATVRVRRMARLLRFAEPASSELRDEVARLASRLGLRRVPEALLIPGKMSPMLWSLGGMSRLLLPAELLAKLNGEQRATLLVHELAHWKRCDHWVRWLEMAALALYWWHPVVWWARRELREAEELCCDAWVVWALPGAGRAYATALVECLDFLSEAPCPLPLGASALSRIDDLKRRMTMILRGNTPRRLTVFGGAVLIGAALLVLPLLPSWAEDQPKRDSKDDRPGGGVQADPKDVEKARADVQKLREELMEQQKKAQAAEAKLREAAEKLNKLDPRHGGGDRRPDDRRPDDRRPGDRRPDERRPDDRRPDDRRPDNVRPGDRRPDDRRPDDRRPDNVRPGDRRPDEFRPGDRRPDNFRPGDRGPNDGRDPGARGDGDRRIQELERRLEGLMREMEELRRQLRGRQGDFRPGDNPGPRDPREPNRPGATPRDPNFRPPMDRPGRDPGPRDPGPREPGREPNRDPRPVPRPQYEELLERKP